MTRKQLRHKFAELKRNMNKDLNAAIEQAIKSGAIDIKSHPDNFILPRIVFAACLQREVNQFDLRRIDHQKEANNLYLFL